MTAPFELCHIDADCVVKHHQTDCCGTELAVGAAATTSTAYDDCEHAWATHFPACDCAAQPLKTEDGKPVTDPTRIVVRCTNVASGAGRCQTSMP